MLPFNRRGFLMSDLSIGCLSLHCSYPTPKETSKTAIALHDADGALIHQAKLAEDALSHDPTSPHGNADVPPFHGYSKAGTAIGQLVYAHSGTVEDFERLRGAGVDVKGKIALVRYGGNFRGLKVKAASEAGAAGVIIYSDPAEDNGSGSATVSYARMLTGSGLLQSTQSRSRTDTYPTRPDRPVSHRLCSVAPFSTFRCFPAIQQRQASPLTRTPGV